MCRRAYLTGTLVAVHEVETGMSFKELPNIRRRSAIEQNLKFEGEGASKARTLHSKRTMRQTTAVTSLILLCEKIDSTYC